MTASFRLSAYELATFTSKKAKSVATPACRALAERFVATWAVGKRAPPDVDLDAAVVVALYGVAEVLGRERDVVHLARVLVRAVHLGCRRVSVAFDDPEPHSSSWSYFEESATPHFEHDHAVSTIAENIASRLDEDRAGVRDVIAPAHAGAPIATRVLYGVAMADDEWLREAGRAFLSENKRDHPQTLASWLFHVVGDVELLNALAKRFPQDVPLAVLEKHGAALTQGAIAHHASDPNDEHATRALARIENVEAARQLARSLTKARCGAIAKEWFRAHPELARAALDPLRDDAELGIYVRAVLDPRPAALVTEAGKKPLPSFANPAALPPLAHVDATDVLHALRASTLAKPSPFVAAARVAEDASRLGAFAKALFEQWLVANGPSLDVWAMHALAHLGDDDCARALATLVLDWPRKAQNNRARAGVNVLAALGTPYALMQLERIADQSKYEVLRKDALAALDALASSRKLTRAALADRSTPDLGLDARSIARFDYGPRVIEITVGDDLTLDRLPKAKASDDAAQVELAAKGHKALKDDVKMLHAMQVVRLERAMCEQQRWSGADFRAFVIGHPIVAAIARRLVWGVFDGKTLAATFALAEDGAPMTCEGRPFALADGASVGVVHRLEMTDEDARAWGEHLAQHEKLPPFDQIGRAVHTPDPAQRSSALARFADAQLADDGIEHLEARGWRKVASKELLKGMSVIAIAMDRTHIDRVRAAPDLSKIEFSELVREIDAALAE